MKKDRNAFFSEYGFASGMNPNMGMPGGNMQYPYPGGHPGGMPMPTDVDARISKIERQLNRLETRISKLEGDTGAAPMMENDFNFNNSMYMI